MLKPICDMSPYEVDAEIKSRVFALQKEGIFPTVSDASFSRQVTSTREVEVVIEGARPCRKQNVLEIKVAKIKKFKAKNFVKRKVIGHVVVH